MESTDNASLTPELILEMRRLREEVVFLRETMKLTALYLKKYVENDSR